MRTITMVLSAILLTLISLKVSAAPAPTKEKDSVQTCRIVTGYGTAIAKGKSHKEALEKARLECGTRMIDMYFAQRQGISEDQKEDLALACVNLDCQ
jgi:hypothetical protein